MSLGFVSLVAVNAEVSCFGCFKLRRQATCVVLLVVGVVAERIGFFIGADLLVVKGSKKDSQNLNDYASSTINLTPSINSTKTSDFNYSH